MSFLQKNLKAPRKKGKINKQKQLKKEVGYHTVHTHKFQDSRSTSARS